MIDKGRGAIASLLTTTILTACVAPPVSTMPQQVEEVASYLVGVMDTSAQAKAVPDAPDVRMTTCKVRLADSQDAQTIYLYQEQAMSANLGAPYRQRFLRLALSEDGQQVESASFKPLDSQAWVGFCQKPEAERRSQLSLMEPKHCSVFLEPMENGNGYLGNTQSGGCPTNFRGAVTITNTIKLNAAGMDTLDRGFDAEGNLVWGAQERPYKFRKLGNGE
jgi:hypothetical protein